MSSSKKYFKKDPMKWHGMDRGAGWYYNRGKLKVFPDGYHNVNKRNYWSKEDLAQDYQIRTGPQRIGYGITPKNTKRKKGLKDYSHYGDYSSLKMQAKKKKWK